MDVPFSTVEAGAGVRARYELTGEELLRDFETGHSVISFEAMLRVG